MSTRRPRPFLLLLASALMIAAACGNSGGQPATDGGPDATGSAGTHGDAGTSGSAGTRGGAGTTGSAGATGAGACFDGTCNGVCTGDGCNAAWTCDTTPVACTSDIAPYCGCDGKTFMGSSSCPARAWAYRGACEDGASCDASKILCKIVAPQCPAGQVPSVSGSCYGPCVPIEMCACAAAADCPDVSQYTCHVSAKRCGPFVN